MESDLISHPDTWKYEALIDGLVEKQFAVVDHFLPEELLIGLRQNLLSLYHEGCMHPAGVGKRFSYQKNLKVRGDQIFWIEKNSEDRFESWFIEQINQFIEHLNRTCFTGINEFEFHYSYYEEGSFYRRHLDQFKVDLGRKFSLVSYLNDDWLDVDGGKLILYLDGQEIGVYPYGGRSIFFRSDEIEHEVRLASRPRISIAGWLKRT